MQRNRIACLVGLALVLLAPQVRAAGTLTPKGGSHAPIDIVNHHVNVVINNGFARTEVLQTFENPNQVDLEAIYAVPVPRSASLSEVTLTIGEREIHGEVVERNEAETIYDEERRRGNDAGIANKNQFYVYEFRVARVPAGDQVGMRYVYYQPLEIDTGVGRYLYPLEEGGTDEVAESFWTMNDAVLGSFSARVEIKSAWPLHEVRLPGFENAAQVNRLDEGHFVVELAQDGATLNRDLLVYYRLQPDLPGRVELVTYRESDDGPGTFMMVVTPGLDLQPITRGADYVFVLDVSGSMEGKLQTLANGVARALGKLQPQDRFRIVTFSDRARDLTNGWVVAMPDHVTSWVNRVGQLHTEGGTNLYAGIQLGLRDLDADRATSLILVTDAVANQGVVDPAEFHKLMRKYDVRVFGFLMGNSSNWPLMRTIADASGGFYSQVSNADDIIGQILLAKSKVTHEALHDAQVKIRGVKTHDVTQIRSKVYRGQQLVLFGRYADGGPARVTLEASLTGQDKVYETEFDFPEVDQSNPELERLWAMDRIEEIETLTDAGVVRVDEGEEAITGLGVTYQLVTDYTSMLVLSDEKFEEYGIDRRNRERVTREHAAQAQRAAQPPANHRVDRSKPMFQHNAPSVGGGGALDPVSGTLLLGLAGLAALSRRRGNRR